MKKVLNKMTKRTKVATNWVIKKLDDFPTRGRYRDAKYFMTQSNLMLELIENKKKVIPILQAAPYDYPALFTDSYNLDGVKQPYEYEEESVRGGGGDEGEMSERGDIGEDEYNEDTMDTHYSRLNNLLDENTMGGNGDDGSLKRKRENEAEPPTQTPDPSPASQTLVRQDPLQMQRDRQKEAMDRELKMNEEKQLMIAKFSLLTRQYKHIKVPYVSMSSDLQHMKNEYNQIMRTLKGDENYHSYRQYLTFGFYGVEYVLGNVFNMNMKGYAASQIASLDRYDSLLIELGDKHYIPDAPERFPVEVRLLFMIVVQTAVFIVMNKIQNSLDASAPSGFFGIINNIIGSSHSSPPQHHAQQAQQAPNPQPQTSGRMSGPKPE